MAEKEACGIRLSVWAKIANMLLGALMIFYSIITFFTIALDIFDDASFILIISFRIYEMYVISPIFFIIILTSFLFLFYSLFGLLLVLSFCEF